MRILHIDMGKEMRGGQHQVLILMKGLRNAGHTSTLLARSNSPLWNATQDLGFAVTSGSLSAIWQESPIADIVHVHDAYSHTLAAMASRNRFVVSRRVAFAVKRGWLSRWKYRRPERFLAVSNFVAHELKNAGVPNGKTDVVYDGVEIDDAPRRETPSSRYIVALASSDPQKGRDLIERASVLTKIPVLFSEDLTGDLKGASLFLYITRSEGLGSAALLAMSLAVPVIASRAGGLPEIIIDGWSGLLVENDPGDIAAAILKIMNNPALGEWLGRNGRTEVERKFSAKRMIDETMNSYNKALNGRC